MMSSRSLLEFSAAFVLITNSFCASYQVEHEIAYIIGCFPKGNTEVQYEFDKEDMAHIDFVNQTVVYTYPAYLSVDPKFLFDGIDLLAKAEKAKTACMHAMIFLIAEVKPPPEEQDPPDSIIYAAEEVQLGVENRLICFFNHFYPPSIKVNWTKNGLPVSDGVSLSQFYPNDDQTFHQFSSLRFTPTEGDVYHCTVEHSALDKPKTKTWEYEANHEIEYKTVVPDVVCGVGLAVGMLGVICGILLMFKRYRKNPFLHEQVNPRQLY